MFAGGEKTKLAIAYTSHSAELCWFNFATITTGEDIS